MFYDIAKANEVELKRMRHSYETWVGMRTCDDLLSQSFFIPGIWKFLAIYNIKQREFNMKSILHIAFVQGLQISQLDLHTNNTWSWCLHLAYNSSWLSSSTKYYRLPVTVLNTIKAHDHRHHDFTIGSSVWLRERGCSPYQKLCSTLLISS